MARSQAANLTGLLSNIGGTLGKMGEPGQQYVDTFRRSMAPEVDASNSDSLMNYANYARRNGYDDEARQYTAMGYQQKTKEAEEAERLTEQARLQNGQAGVADMSRKMMTILKNPNLSKEDRETQLNALQESANVIARATPNMNPIEVSSLRTNVEKAFLGQASVEQQMDLAEQQNERDWQTLAQQTARLEMAEEELAMARDKHGEWVDTADYRETLRGLEQGKAGYENSLMLAKRLAGTEGGREKFNAATGGGYEGVFDSVNEQRTAQQLQIDEARQRLETGKFSYKKDDLISLGIPDEIAANIIKLGKNLPNAGNQMVVTALKSVLGNQEAPTSAMLGLFEGAALHWVANNYDHDGADTAAKDEGMANTLALKMADVFMKTGSMEEALKVISLVDAQGAATDSDDEFADLARQVNQMLSESSDATDPDQ